MSANIPERGKQDIFREGAYLRVGRPGSIDKQVRDSAGKLIAPIATNPLTTKQNPAGKVTFDVNALPWKDGEHPQIVSSGENAGENKYLVATAADKPLKLKKDAHSNNFYIGT